MNIKNIKTKTEFYEFSDIWYQRTKNLALIWMDNDIDEIKRARALLLWNIMRSRVLALSQIAFQMNQPKAPSNLKSGTVAKINYIK